MESPCTIVVSDTALLQAVCGTNDSNLKLIEEHLGVPVFSRGNEVSIDERNPEVCEKFRFIIDRILDEAKTGSEHCEDVVASVLNTKAKVALSSFAIAIHGSDRKIYPRSEHQAEYIQMMRTHDLVLCTGPAGTGKTFLAASEALRLVLSHEKSKLVITRPVVEAGESLGFLPGDLEQKLNPYVRPLYDALEASVSHEVIQKLFDAGIIEIAPLAYMRGRTLRNAAIILDEAQNTTKAQMKMFLTRIGENSKIFATGDITQADLPKNVESGLQHALRVLSNIEEIGKIVFDESDVIRSSLAKKIVKAYSYE